MPESPVRLTIEKGKVVKVEGGAEARKLENIMTAAGESGFVVSEVGAGMNPYLTVSSSNADKKISGTFHIAVGGNYTPCFGGIHPDGKNKSAIHLDLVVLAPVKFEIDDYVLVDDGKLLV